jgi:hypothetical protein
MGVEYFTPHLPPYGSIEERSQSLIKKISSKYRGRTVHLFGHSMGGLNARDIAANSNLDFQVKTVTTFGTPHRGVKMINPVPGADGSSALAGHIRKVIGSDLGAMGNLTHAFMSKYNNRTANNPTVKYFSWAGETAVPTTLFIAIFPSSRLFGSTDGLVNVNSAKWEADLGPGIHLGTVHGLDHVSIIGRMTVAATIPHLKAAESGLTSVVQPVDNNLLQSVARRVEGNANTTLAPTRAVMNIIGFRF